jgi:hypothetical protein
MKVDRNQLTTPVEDTTIDMDTGLPMYRSAGGTPLRLEIAARLLAGVRASYPCKISARDISEALGAADALIKAHNETCEEGE